MVRAGLGVIAGCFTWFALAAVILFAVRAAWPAYAAAEPSMAFDLPMMATRLAASSVALIAGGVLASRIAPMYRLVPMIAGLVLLAAFIPIHLSLWNKFPIWYHLSFLASLPLLTFLGGALNPKRA